MSSLLHFYKICIIFYNPRTLSIFFILVPNIFLRFAFHFMWCIYCVRVYEIVSAGTREAERGHEIPWSWDTGSHGCWHFWAISAASPVICLSFCCYFSGFYTYCYLFSLAINTLAMKLWAHPFSSHGVWMQIFPWPLLSKNSSNQVDQDVSLKGRVRARQEACVLSRPQS